MWIKKKTGIPSNKIDSHQQLIDKSRGVDNLAVYVGPLDIQKFKVYLEVAKDLMTQDDIEFAHIDTYTYSLGDRDTLNMPTLKTKGYGVRVYRKKNLKDY